MPLAVGGTQVPCNIGSQKSVATAFNGGVDWRVGSLARHCTDQINGLIAGKTDLNVFDIATWASTPASFPRNADCWANGIDLSCASPWNSQSGSIRAGTLVSKRHVVFANHEGFYLNNGATITFVTPDSQAVVREVIASQRVGTTDIHVGLLGEDVPQGIAFAKVLPSNWSAYMSLTGGGFNRLFVPVLWLNQTETAAIRHLPSLGQSASTDAPGGVYANYSQAIATNDSGNPMFLVINGEPVLLACQFTPGAGPHLAHHATAVNAAMSALGGGYQLTTVDLSAFTQF